MCRGIGVFIRRRDQTGGRVSIQVDITTARGIVNVTLIRGDRDVSGSDKSTGSIV